jgi:hypothetical protein
MSAGGTLGIFAAERVRLSVGNAGVKGCDITAAWRPVYGRRSDDVEATATKGGYPLSSRTRLRRATLGGQCANRLRSHLRTMTRATALRKSHQEGALSRLTMMDGLLCVTCR